MNSNSHDKFSFSSTFKEPKIVLVFIIFLFVTACFHPREAKVEVMISLAQASPIKLAIVEYYLEKDRWPQNNAELKLPPPDQLANQPVAALRVVNGTIEINLKGNATQGLIKLTPDAKNMQPGIQWRCASPDIENIAALSSDKCSYQKINQSPLKN